MMQLKAKINIDLLLDRRNKANLTHEAIANRIYISSSTYSMIEAGYRRPSVDVAMKLGRLLEFDWWKLFIESPDGPGSEPDNKPDRIPQTPQ